MKKIYIAKTIFTLVIFTFISLKTYAQVRIVQVDPTTNVVTIHNYGGTTVDISSYWFCQFPSYVKVSLMAAPITGSTMLTSGADVTITSSVNFGVANGEFGLYNNIITNADFGNASKILDYLEWGTSGHTRESVAIAAGIWTIGTTITASAPYQYTGDGSQNGVGFWSTVLGIEDFKNKVTFKISPNPTESILNLQLLSSLENGNIIVFDMLGKQILNSKININNNIAQLDVSNISNGLYLVRVSSGGNTQVKRFIKQ